MTLRRDDVKVLAAGVTRKDRQMSDGRTIRYYDTLQQDRSCVDRRESEGEPTIGELRLDPLVNEWVAVAAHRQERIFLPPTELCPLCPTRGELLTEIPESDFEVVIFDNRSPSLRPPTDDWALPEMIGPSTETGKAAGKCEVICFTPDHGQSFCDLTIGQVRILMEAWRDRTSELSQFHYIEHIAPFENRGEEIGVTLSHPHGQIYAYSYLPPRVQRMLQAASEYHGKTGRVLMDDVVAREIRDEVRIIARNSDWIAYVPYAARYPFEIHVAPVNPVADLTQLSERQADLFPEIALEVTRRLDGVFGIPMAYIAAWHQAPVRQGRDILRLHWQVTSIRRGPGKLKYLAGSEAAMGAFIMDMTSELSAKQLQDVKLS